MAEARAMATACAAQACTPSRVSTSVDAKPQQPLASARIPSPSDSLSANVPTSPFFVLRSRRRISTTRASAKEAPRVFAVSSASAVQTCISPTTAETISGGTTFFEFVERGTGAVLGGALGPGSQIVLLLRRELIDVDSHGFELELGNLAIDGIRHRIDLPLQFRAVLNQIFGGKRLIGEAHIHHSGRMAFGGGEIDEAAFAEQIDPTAIFHGKFLDERARG